MSHRDNRNRLIERAMSMPDHTTPATVYQDLFTARATNASLHRRTQQLESRSDRKYRAWNRKVARLERRWLESEVKWTETEFNLGLAKSRLLAAQDKQRFTRNLLFFTWGLWILSIVLRAMEVL